MWVLSGVMGWAVMRAGVGWGVYSERLKGIRTTVVLSGFSGPADKETDTKVSGRPDTEDLTFPPPKGAGGDGAEVVVWSFLRLNWVLRSR